MWTTQLLLVSCACSGALWGAEAENDELLAMANAPKFAPVVRLEADGKQIATEEPGYAAPAWYDVDKDGRGDLVVGQFAGGKLQVFRGLEGGGFAKGEFLKAEGKVASVPGVW